MNKVFLFSFTLILLVISACTDSSETGTTEITSPAALNSELPFLYRDNTGQIFLSWVEPGSSKNEYKLLYSKLEEDKWSNPQIITSSKSWFVNWADYPSVVAYSGKPVAAHQLKKVPGNTYSYNVNISLRKEDNTWSEPLTPHSDSTATEHGFVSMVPLNNQNIMAIWLDGRRTADRSEEEYSNLAKAMTLRSAIIDSSGSVIDSELIDESVCDCCSTSMVLTPKGPVAAYRNRTQNEIRDIYISRYRNNSWSEPKPVYSDNWKIGACPVNGPTLAAKDSLVAVAWYTAADGKPTVKAAVSQNFGETFNKPFTISTNETLGRVDIVIDNSNSVYISEINENQEKHYLTTHRLSLAEEELSSYETVEINGSRRSGFPQMELLDDGKLIFAWTDVVTDKPTRVKTAIVQRSSI